jgi:hypothetical protein
MLVNADSETDKDGNEICRLDAYKSGACTPVKLKEPIYLSKNKARFIIRFVYETTIHNISFAFRIYELVDLYKQMAKKRKEELKRNFAEDYDFTTTKTEVYPGKMWIYMKENHDLRFEFANGEVVD